MIFLAEVNCKFASSADLKITCYGNKDSFHGQSSITVSFFFLLPICFPSSSHRINWDHYTCISLLGMRSISRLSSCLC